MHHKDLKIKKSLYTLNKGIILITDLDFNLNHKFFTKGDTFRYDSKIYEIINVETIPQIDGKELIISNLFDKVGFLIKEITIHDLLKKSVSLEKSPWLKQAEWRQKNNWWLKHWQQLQIQWYCNIKPFFVKEKE